MFQATFSAVEAVFNGVVNLCTLLLSAIVKGTPLAIGLVGTLFERMSFMAEKVFFLVLYMLEAVFNVSSLEVKVVMVMC